MLHALWVTIVFTWSILNHIGASLAFDLRAMLRLLVGSCFCSEANHKSVHMVLCYAFVYDRSAFRNSHRPHFGTIVH